MNRQTVAATAAAPSVASSDEATERTLKVAEFVRTNPAYYAHEFERIGSESKFVWTFNPWAGLLGPIWFGARGLWNWGLTFLIIETFAFVEINRGLFGDLAASAWERIGKIEGTLELRRKQLASAIEQGSDKIDVYKRTVQSLEDAIGGIRLEAKQLEESGLYIAFVGLAVLIAVKVAQSVYANTVLERRFSDWLSDSRIASGMPARHMALSVVFAVIIVVTTVIHYSFPGAYPLLAEFPTEPGIRLTSIDWVEAFFYLLRDQRRSAVRFDHAGHPFVA